MGQPTIEMLSPERVTELWPQLEPLVVQACEGNEIAEDEMSANDMYILGITGMCVFFVWFDDGVLLGTVVLQFNTTNGRKGADVIALAGRKLLLFKSLYWNAILDWLRANEIVFLDAYVPNERAKMYLNKFGFNKSCSYVRMTL